MSRKKGYNLWGSVSGDAVKGYYVAKLAPKKVEAVTTVLLDRVVGLAGLMAVALFAALLNTGRILANHDLQYVACALAGLLGVIVLCICIPMSERLRSTTLVKFCCKSATVKRMYEAVALYKNHKITLLKTIFLSCLVQSIMILAFYFGSLGITPAGATSPAVSDYFFLTALALFLNILPVSPGGLGVGETASDRLFRMVGFTEGAGSMLLFRFMMILMSLGGLYLYLKSPKQTEP